MRERWRDASRHLWFRRQQQTDARPQGRQQVVHSSVQRACARGETGTVRLGGGKVGGITSAGNGTQRNYVQRHVITTAWRRGREERMNDGRQKIVLTSTVLSLLWTYTYCYRQILQEVYIYHVWNSPNFWWDKCVEVLPHWIYNILVHIVPIVCSQAARLCRCIYVRSNSTYCRRNEKRPLRGTMTR